MNSPADKPSFVYVIYIRTTAETLWQALIDPEFTGSIGPALGKSRIGKPAPRGAS